jgi:diguanylate cyclase (GGDEF)-like protein/PAS domain S-box-containing protein
MIHTLKVALTKTLYRQLVIEVTLALTLVLSLFGWEMLRRQQHQETQQQQEQVMALASSLATSSRVWVSARDYSGLQEIVQGVAQFPDLRYAMVLDTTGLILAHQDVTRRGQYLTDLPEPTRPRVLKMSGHVTDVTQPILLDQQHTGWVRVGVANDSFDAEFSKTKRDIVVFTIFSIIFGALLASFTARYQTRRLRQVEHVARALQLGHGQLRAEVSGTDEAAQLALHFNAMLDRLEDRERALQQSKTLLRQSQHLGKIGGWEWDTEKSSMYWTAETFHIHDMPVETEGKKVQAAIEKSAACYPPEDRKIVLKAFWLCTEQGVPYDLECRFVTVKQRQLWIRTQGQAEMRDGKVVKVVGYIADITERKQLEKQAHDAALYARTLIEVNQDPLIIIGCDGKITDVNHATELATGRQRPSLIGSEFANYFTEPDKAHTAFLDTLSQGAVKNCALGMRHVNGHITEVVCSTSVYRGDDGMVLGVSASAHDITERKKMEDDIRSLAYFDPLTTLPNRRMLSDRLQSAMAGGQRSGSYGALIYLDLDNFKPLNDTHGHAAGDLLLMEVAQRLRHCIRQVDTVGRTGGDEFVVILNGLSTEASAAAEQGQQIASKILVALSMPYVLCTAPNGPDTPLIDHHCTASLGVALFRGYDVSLQEVMKKADAAMYQAKAAGRNQIQFDAAV